MFLYDKDGRGQLTERFYVSSDLKKSPTEQSCALFTVSKCLVDLGGGAYLEP